jgi:hypothetical protein
MTMRTPLTVAITLALLTSAPAAFAQQELLEAPRHRQGYYLSAGFAGGAGKNWQDGDSLGVASGGTFGIHLGQLLTPRLGLGVIFENGKSKKGTIDFSQFGLGLEGSVGLVGNLALHATAGFGVLQIDDKGDDKSTLEGAYGAQYGLGLSYDFFPFQHNPLRSGGFAIAPSLDVRLLPEDSATNLSVLVGVAFTWWSGLPRHQLELPESEAYKKK